MTIDPTSLLNAAEAIAADRGYDAAEDELWAKYDATHFKAKQERNAILATIGMLRRRKGEYGFYEHKAKQEAAKA